MNIRKLLYIFLSIGFFSLALYSCTDDADLTMPEPNEDTTDYSGIPEEILNGYSVTFKMSLGPMGGEEFGLTTRATSTDLRDIEYFIDLEKLRVLFFVCLDDDDNSGKSDIFLFESKSRWISMLNDNISSTTDTWQVTSPIFTYGNNEEYDWDMIQDILKERPFKIAILANRPDKIRYSDFDTNKSAQQQDPNLFTGGEFSFDNKGPIWGLEQSTQAIEDYKYAKEKKFKGVVSGNYTFKGESVNNLHHCQWDPVYAFKNSTEKAGSYQCYDFILKDPDATAAGTVNKNKNWMGAVSYWTHWRKNPDTGKYYHDGSSKETKLNWYFWPDRDQGIPMYGIQKFNPLTNWLKGTPFNISERQTGESGQYARKNVHLLRSLARIDLIIPKKFGEVRIENGFDGDARKPNEEGTVLMYSNVFGRCEPLDVATPTEEIWAKEHGSTTSPDRCEFWNIFDYGPIINTTDTKTGVDYFLQRMAWFYGAWQEWGWFKDNKKNVNATYFDKFSSSMDYPRIFNPCIQRNQYAYLSNVMIEDSKEYHFIIYTGERNINDPSKFTEFKGGGAELAYFKLIFKAEGNDDFETYIIPLAHNSSQNANSFFTNSLKNLHAELGATEKGAMATLSKKENGMHDYNWPIVRNHVYTFSVAGISGLTDDDGLNSLIISSEERSTPWIDFD